MPNWIMINDVCVMSNISILTDYQLRNLLWFCFWASSCLLEHSDWKLDEQIQPVKPIHHYLEDNPDQ